MSDCENFIRSLNVKYIRANEHDLVETDSGDGLVSIENGLSGSIDNDTFLQAPTPMDNELSGVLQDFEPITEVCWDRLSFCSGDILVVEHMLHRMKYCLPPILGLIVDLKCFKDKLLFMDKVKSRLTYSKS